MLKIANIRSFLRRWRAPLFAVLAALAALTAFFLGVRGIVYDAAPCPAQIVYGEAPSYKAKAVFGRVSYEYAPVGSDNWTAELPRGVGEYKVRGVSVRTFGAPSHGKAYVFSVAPKEIDVTVDASSGVYGEKPAVSAALADGDRIECTAFEYEDPSQKTTLVSPVKDCIAVYDAAGTDVTDFYVINAVKSEITFQPRPITVVIADAEKIYDGAPLSFDRYELTGGLADGDGLEASFPRSRVEVGETPNEPELRIVAANGADVTQNYKITVRAGALRVLRRPVRIAVEGAEKTYDGTPLSHARYALDAAAPLLHGHTLSLISGAQLTDAGERENTLEFRISDEAGEDVTKNYELLFPDCGKLKVTPRPITVRTGGAVKTYDGTALCCPDYTIGDETPLVEGHRLRASLSGAQTRAGTSENKIAAATVTSADGGDVTHNYVFDYEYGELKVTPRPVTLLTGNGEWIYDGTAHRNADIVPTSAYGPVAGQEIRAVSSSEITDCGALPNVFAVRIFDGAADVTDCYEIFYEYGELKVTPRPVTVRAGDKSRVYDGKPLTDNGYTVVSEHKLAEGQIGKIVCSGSQTEAGSSENTVVSFLVFDGDRDVTSNYSISFMPGELTVTPRPITALTASGEWIYDGETHFQKGCEIVSELALVEGHSLLVREYTEATDAADTANVLVVLVFDGDRDVTRNYEISYELGSLKVLPRPLKITTGSSQWIYDGKEHFDETYTIFSELTPGLVSGHEARLLNKKLAMDAGEKENELEIAVFAGERDVTYNYKIVYEYGTLKVLPRPVTVTAGSAEKMYDDTPLTCGTYEITSELSPVLVGGHTMYVTNGGSITDAGSEKNPVIRVSIFDGDRDVTSNYEVAKKDGTLTVARRPITVYTESEEWIYDGEAHTGRINYLLSEAELVPGHTFAEFSFTSIKFVGERSNEKTVRIYKAELDVTDNYEISYEYGVMKVVPRPITVKAGSAEKIYDGTPLTCGTFEAFSEFSFAIAKADRGRVENTGSQTDAGVSENTIVRFSIVSASGSDLTANYAITYESGTLTVYKRPIAIRAESAEKTYDDTPLSVRGYYVRSGYEPVEGHVLIAEAEGSRTEAGTSYIQVKNVVIRAGERDVTQNYEIECEYGRLIVKPIVLKCRTYGAEKPYDGTPLMREGAEFIGGRTLDYHTLTIRGASGWRKLPGSTRNWLDYTVIDERTQRDVSHNYFFDTEYLGLLTVFPVEITVQTGSKTKMYDGTPLTYDEWELVEGEFYDGYDSTIDVQGSRLYAGSSANWAEVRARDPYGSDVSAIYEVTWILGVLTVLPDPDNPDSWGKEEGEGGGGGSGGKIEISESGQINKTPGGGGSGGQVPIVFYATGSHTQRVYFRIKSFGDYEPEYGWLGARTYGGKLNPLHLTYYALQNAGKSLSTVNIEAAQDDLPYMLPYYTDPTSYRADSENDTQVTVSQWRNYRSSYISYEYAAGNTFSLQGTEYETLERNYRNFVRDYYVRLPGATKDSLLAVAKRERLDPKDPKIVEKVARLVQKTVRYDLDFEEYEGDLAVYFFTKAQTGICQHYATAATAMYRALGIPARYVTGFVGDVSAGKKVAVTTQQAHAWVEVYLDGMGWVQMEATGEGFSHGGSGGGGEGETELPSGKFTVKPIDVDKEYDGTPLYAENVLEGLILEELIESGYTYASAVAGSRTDYGESESRVTSFRLYDPFGVDVTDNFSVVFNPGSILITKPQILVSVYSLQKYYDGKPLSYGKKDYTLLKIPDGFTLAFDLEGSLTNAGKLSLRKLSYLPYVVYDAHGNDVTEDYYVKFVGEPLQVNRRMIELTSVSKVKEYDGTPLTGEEVWVSKGSLLPGHRMEAETPASITDVGQTENRIKRVKIYDENGRDVTANYRILINPGTLTVEKSA